MHPLRETAHSTRLPSLHGRFCLFMCPTANRRSPLVHPTTVLPYPGTVQLPRQGHTPPFFTRLYVG
eukprot:3502260-Pleurochrysis_carterae.AAC.1